MARTTDFSSGRSAGSPPRARQSDVDASDALDSVASSKPIGKSYSDDMQWRHTAIFGAGIALGALIGAGAALLFAPQSGDETREFLSERARGFGGRIGDRIDDARGDLNWYMRRGRRKLR
ncbi:MAG: YtxH domain-containing protein, partial [Gemmatimonadota bacterium]|nr:YtxH domain-containing protein [Gemmatimonadota bacterium]